MKTFATYRKEFHQELYNILEYWSTEVFDEKTGDIIGEIDHYGTKNPEANKGIILCSRMMWTFSAACRFYKNNEYKPYADKVRKYIETYLYDSVHGGYFWEVSSQGDVIVSKKQVYAQSFVIYAYAEYYLAFGDTSALQSAMDLFTIMESNCKDKVYGGYFEAFSQSWDKLDDVRLSVRDLNLPKGMNTNLHVLEAYTTLYEATKSKQVEHALRAQIAVYSQKIIDDNNHVVIFFTEDWTPQTHEYSFGHDIESSWLLWEAAEVLHDKQLLQTLKPQIVAMVETFLQEGFDYKTNSALYEYFKQTNEYDTDRHWWVQVEAMEGLANAYRITGDKKYRNLVFKIWQYIQVNLIDKVHGEWFWRIDNDGYPVDSEPKVSMWKCPYHNGRALMRVIEKIETWEE